jgi:hypothetical protein
MVKKSQTRSTKERKKRGNLLPEKRAVKIQPDCSSRKKSAKIYRRKDDATKNPHRIGVKKRHIYAGKGENNRNKRSP